MMDEIQNEIARTRLEIERTLAAIEDKLNVPKQAKKAGKRVQDSVRKNPVAWAASAAVFVIGVVGVISLVTRRR